MAAMKKAAPPEGRRKCPRCGQVQHLKKFTAARTSRLGVRHLIEYKLCSDCRTADARNSSKVSVAGYQFGRRVPLAENRYWPVGNDVMMARLKKEMAHETAYS